MKRPVILGILFFAFVMAAVVYSTMTQAKHRVEVCVDFHGAQACRTASGADEQSALRAATNNACALVASGVTDSIACENARPTKITWLNK